MRETIKASETKHEASGCARELHELRASRTAEPKRPSDRESDQEPIDHWPVVCPCVTHTLCLPCTTDVAPYAET